MMPFKLPQNISVKDHHSDLNQVGKAVILSKFKDFDSDALILDDQFCSCKQHDIYLSNKFQNLSIWILSANFI